MGVNKLLGGGAPKGPSAEELRKQQEEAARKERDKIAQETAGSQAAAQKQMAAAQGDTRQLASGLIDEETGRKRFLKGI